MILPLTVPPSSIVPFCGCLNIARFLSLKRLNAGNMDCTQAVSRSDFDLGGYCGDFEGDNVKMNLAEQDRPPPPPLKMNLSAAPPPAGFLVSTRPPFKQNSLYFDCVTLGGTTNLWHTCHA